MKGSSVNSSKKSFYLKLIALLALFALVLVLGLSLRQENEIFNSEIASDYLKADVEPNTEVTATENEIIVPSSFLIKNFPFQSQAPFANWDKLHDEACEEASVILVKYYLSKEKLTAGKMDAEILKMVDWQEKNWQGHFDITTSQTLELAKSIYGLKGKVTKDATMDDLKKEISSGHPVIVPTAGRLLGNPNFRAPGPVYHMVVAIGYNEKEIIVQDVGTKRGDHFVYSQKIFYNAWHDWAGSKSNIEQGSRNYLVISN